MAAEIVRDGLYFGEGPRWRSPYLWYSDFYDHAVHRMDESGHDERVIEVAAQPSGLGWLPDGRMLVVAMRDRAVLRQEPDGALVTHADLSAFEPFMNNDMVVDAEGRAYVGGFGFDLDAVSDGRGEAAAGERPRPTVLSLVQPDGTASVAADDMGFPNGSVITPDRSTLIVGESMGGRLTAFDRNPDGTLTNRRVWADLSAAGAVPDGICLDEAGAVWLADPLSTRCVRVEEGGRVLEEAVFGEICYACALGGADGRTLYALTAPSSHSQKAAAEPLGRIEAVRVSVPGAGSP
ncbi:MAG TPA: SMP-30/gluconolactonase/LRE family protein [Acidimicrobiales bacterium]|nr:SMP-30/gluconolactonase/LRE family protein [Acidimicrobiales bacterium]